MNLREKSWDHAITIPEDAIARMPMPHKIAAESPLVLLYLLFSGIGRLSGSSTFVVVVG